MKSRLSCFSDLFCTTKEGYFRSSSQMATTLLCNGSSMRFHHFIIQSGDDFKLCVSSSLFFMRKKMNIPFFTPKPQKSFPRSFPTVLHSCRTWPNMWRRHVLLWTKSPQTTQDLLLAGQRKPARPTCPT